MAFAREIILQILQNIRFRVPNTGEKQSYYTTIGDTLVRVSDHCTWMYVWDNFLENNPKLKGKPIVSIVFEDTGDTFTEDCLLIKRFRRNPIKVNEFVYPLHGNAQYLSKQDVQSIIKGLKGLLNSTEFVDPTEKGKYELRVSKNPPDNTINNKQTDTNQTQNQENNQQTNENKTMNKKQTIRLNESQLRQIVKESVKRVLNDENGIIKTFKHCHISKHPLKDEYMVVNDTFKNIPPFFGTKRECEKAAIAADKSAENHLNTLIEKARKDGYSEDEISKAVEKLLKRTI